MKATYIVLGTNDLSASIKFYDALFEQSDIGQVGATDRMTFWQGDGFAFAVAVPFDEEPASNGNGTMIGFDAGSKAEVRRLHQRVLDLGGTSEGDPGQRGPRFSAYARDLDQNKLCFFE